MKYLLPLALIITSLTACAEYNSLNGTTTVTSKSYVKGNCEDHCTPDQYTLYYSNGKYAVVSQEAYDKAKVGE
jgi:hypothetical protein